MSTRGEISKPHIETKEEGLRNVDLFHDFSSVEELNEYLDKCELIGVGSNALVFLVPNKECAESETLLRFEILNPVGTEWTLSLLDDLLCKYPSFFQELSFLKEKVNSWVSQKSVKKQIKESRLRIKNEVSGHNSAFRRNHNLTMPINSYYMFQGNWFGVRIKYLNGVSLGRAFPQSEISDYASNLLREPNTNNVLIGISNSTVSELLIDICEFIPSSEEIGNFDKEKLYRFTQ